MASIGILTAIFCSVISSISGTTDQMYVNDPRYIGCYRDSRTDKEEQRVLPNWKRQVTSATPITECIRHCGYNGYKYAGLQWLRECRCGSGNYEVLGACNGTNCACDKPCDGNPARICGGAYANSVYVTNFHDTRYLGCFKGEENDPPLSIEITQSLSTISVEECIGQCAQRQHVYAGLLNGEKCFCGNDTHQYRKFGACVWNCSCDSNCPEDPKGHCGGSKALGIYLAVTDQRFEGCYASSGRDFGYRKYIDHFTTSECKFQCKDDYYNYGYAALEFDGRSWRCYCSPNSKDHYFRCELETDCACSSRCPHNATQVCGGDGLAISVFKSGCDDGYYGVQCDQQCHCRSGGCSVETGRCPVDIGCASGWTGPKCDVACPIGSHGENCQRYCSENCLDQNCNRFNGDCLKCAPGMMEQPLCDKKCLMGSFGNECRYKCRCANSHECHFASGACADDVCAAGYTGASKDPACQDKCSGTFGLRCNFTCHCKHQSTCDHVTGTCYGDDCEAGFHGSNCQQACNETKFGENCSFDCHCDGPCDGRTGCETCGPGWHDPPMCQSSASIRAWKVAAGILTVLFLAAILIFLIYWFYRRKHPKLTLVKIDKSMMSFQNLKNTLKRRSGLDNPSMEAGEIYENSTLSHRVKLADLESYIFSTKGKENPFKAEYDALPKDFAHNPSTLGIRSDVKKAKNRFQNVIPYDHNRVPLTREKDNEASEYINASFMKDYRGNVSFIATQGPSENTIRDFFRMLWEHSVPLIVMVTRFVEDGKIKCSSYWDEAAGKPKGIQEFIVTVIKENIYPDYTLRNLLITKGMEERNVLHFHFTSWPDHGVPENANAMLNFRRRVRQALVGLSAPAVVHCSAGIGRTGTFLALDFLLDQAQDEQLVDVFGTVQSMRMDRVNMVQNLDQYIFIYDALLEWHVVGFTPIPAKDFSTTFAEWVKPKSRKGNSILDEQFRLLEKSRKAILKNMEKSADLKRISRLKDRLDDIFPASDYRVNLVTDVAEYGEYINAVFVDGYKRPSAYIATQIPLKQTRADLWRMVKDYNISCIVCFTDDKDFLDKGMPYWPDEDEEMSEGPFTVSCSASTQLGNLLTCVSSDLTLTYKTGSTSYERHLRLLSVMWYSERDSYGPTSDLLELLATITRWQQTQPANTRVAVQSMYGCDKCGVFLAISNLIDMLNAEQEVDVFQVVKKIRKPRAQFIRNIEQYKYLYEAVEQYITGFHLYSNFS